MAAVEDRMEELAGELQMVRQQMSGKFNRSGKNDLTLLITQSI
jgi:hypothetical protein